MEIRELIQPKTVEVQLNEELTLTIRELKTVDIMILDELLSTESKPVSDSTKSFLLMALSFTSLKKPDLKNNKKMEEIKFDVPKNLSELYIRADMPQQVFVKISDAFSILNGNSVETLEK